MINKEKLKKEFSRHAQEYDQYANLQKEIVKELISKIIIKPERILDLGCGTGFVALELAEKYPLAEIYASDISKGMIEEAQKKAIQKNQKNIIYKIEDMEFPEYPEESFDLIISNASLQWANHLPATFARLYKILKPEGCLLFSIFGEKSLRELRKSAKCAFGRKYNYEQTFPTEVELEEYLKKVGFSSLEVKSILIKRYYDSVQYLLKALKHIGAQNASEERSDRLIPKHELRALIDYYQKNYKVENKIVATYEVIYVRAFRVE